MVCYRCIMAVEDLFKVLGFKNYIVSMGTVRLPEENMEPDKLEQIRARLSNLGFELIDDKKTKLIEAIKNTIVKKIHHDSITDLQLNWSTIITEEVRNDYRYLSHLFSSVEGITIEQYIILQKIEKVKELIVYDELSLSEIAWKLNYSSVAHLSNQFKKVTGMRPKEFKNLGNEFRTPLDKV